MEVPVEIYSPRSRIRRGPATVQGLLRTLSLFALMSSIAMLAIAMTTVADMPYEDEFLYGRGYECIVALAFLAVSALSWGLYLSALTLEPVMLPAWEQPSRIVRVVWTFLLRILPALVCRIGPLGSAFLIGARFPYRDPDEATGLRSFTTPDISTRLNHRWLAGTSPHLVYH